MHIRYLGSAGWHISAPGVRLLIDPYLTRPPSRDVLLGRPLTPDEPAITRLLAAHDLHVPAILITHPHFDHLLDAPTIARLSGAQLYASTQAADLLNALGVSDVYVISAGDLIKAGGAQIRVFRTPHRTFLGRVPYAGPLRTPLTPPLPARDYRIAEQFSFLITVSGQRVLLASGIDAEPHTPAEVLISAPDMRPAALNALLKAVQPQVVIANHWDDYFRPFAAPIRPSRMLRNPLRRIDVSAWQQRITAWRTDVRVVVPGHFETVTL